MNTIPIPNFKVFYWNHKKIYDVGELTTFSNGDHQAGISETCWKIWVDGEYQQGNLMIGTGKLDSHGNEIFTKDIVKRANGNTYVIEYNPKHAEFYLKPLHALYDINFTELDFKETIEIIGNEYLKTNLGI